MIVLVALLLTIQMLIVMLITITIIVIAVLIITIIVIMVGTAPSAPPPGEREAFLGNSWEALETKVRRPTPCAVGTRGACCAHYGAGERRRGSGREKYIISLLTL